MCEQDGDWKAEQGNEARRWGRIDAKDGPLHCPRSHQSPRLYMAPATETGPQVYSCLIHMLLSLNVFDHRSKTPLYTGISSSWLQHKLTWNFTSDVQLFSTSQVTKAKMQTTL